MRYAVNLRREYRGTREQYWFRQGLWMDDSNYKSVYPHLQDILSDTSISKILFGRHRSKGAPLRRTKELVGYKLHHANWIEKLIKMRRIV